jgi:hypothetical protein
MTDYSLESGVHRLIKLGMRGRARRNLMRQLLISVRKYSSLHLDYRRAFAFKSFYQVRSRFLGFDSITAGKDINSRIIILGPRMDREMRLSYNNYAADTKGIKLMEGNINYCRLGLLCGGDQCISDTLDAFQNFGIAFPQFYQQMSS